jgi:PIN domain nuclease of toxin-antitoxin system
MIALLDTHAFLWWITEDPKLSSRAREIISASDSQIYVSAASGWEPTIKYGLGKLPLPAPPGELFPDHILRNEFTPLAITMSHALHTNSLPMHHADPFDRLLVSQAQLGRMAVISVDPKIALYDVQVIW